MNLPLARRGSTMSVSYAVDFASLLLLGPNETMIVAAASAFSQCTFRIKERNPIHRTLFSMACLIVTVQAAGADLHWTRRRADRAGLSKFDLGSAEAARRRGDDVFPLQHGDGRDRDRAVDAADRSSRSGTRTSSGARRAISSAPALPRPRVTISASSRTVWSGRSRSLAAPLYATYHGYKVYLGRIEDEQRHVREMADLHLATIEALALAIDAKDQTSQSAHPPRPALCGGARARAWACRENEIQGVKTAALLHDIGKLAVPEHILSKPGPLTPEEFQKIRAHPKVGADIISAVPFPYPVSPLILSHHERWDGKGYPAGLKGEEIPLGARILSVVDYFDALMAERPYHKAMGFEAAIGAAAAGSRQGAGPAGRGEVHRAAARRFSARRRRSSRPCRAAAQRKSSRHAVGRPATGLTPEPAKKNVFDDIALAHREIYALYEIAQAMGTSLGVSPTRWR